MTVDVAEPDVEVLKGKTRKEVKRGLLAKLPKLSLTPPGRRKKPTKKLQEGDLGNAGTSGPLFVFPLNSCNECSKLPVYDNVLCVDCCVSHMRDLPKFVGDHLGGQRSSF